MFNIFSGITASVLVFYFAFTLSGYWMPSAVVTAVFLVLIETSKRITVTAIVRNALQYKTARIGLIVTAVVLISLSISFSYYGAQKTVYRFTAPPEQIASNQITAGIDTKIDNVNKQIENARQTTWKGITTTTSQKTIKSLTDQLNALEMERIRLIQRTETANDKTALLHHETTTITAEHFALITALLELLFIVCAFYPEYYDYRSYVEFASVMPPVIDNSQITVNTSKSTTEGRVKQPMKLQVNDKKPITKRLQKEQEPKQTKITEHVIVQPSAPTVIEINDPDAIKKAIKHVKGRISTYEYRLRHNVGTPETAKRNIETYKRELADLSLKLQSIN